VSAGARIVAVLGFSVRGGGGLHPVCAARVETAAGVARDDDVIVLSGWARTPGGQSEAELMRGAWTGPAARLVLDDGATHTAQNAAHVTQVARSIGAREIIVVTSRWHAPRAGVAFRALLRDTRIAVSLAPAGDGLSLRGMAREAVVWPVFGIQLARARRRP
jgi:uncharacterized SAM-binding protein YcdF (DUF218 family)